MKKFPISETFDSIQGEGIYTGTRMFFIRFAGCSVGKKFKEEERKNFGQLSVYQEKCTTYDGREFSCDTDFRTKDVLTSEQLIDRIPKGVEHVCLTGGEPLNQPLAEFIDFLSDLGFMVHIETSGTVSFTEKYPNYSEQDSLSNPDGGWLWLTVSPKMGVLDEMIGIADEIKLLVDDHFDVSKIPEDILDHKLVWIQPINTEFSVDRKNLDKCIQLLKEHPSWRLSTQMHKIWNVR
jgi:7-carboxy-7-deazaguanine synthase